MNLLCYAYLVNKTNSINLMHYIILLEYLQYLKPNQLVSTSDEL